MSSPGCPTPPVTRHELEANADIETDLKAMLVAGIEELQIARGLRAADILDMVKDAPVDAVPTLRAALHEITSHPSMLPDAKTLSRHLGDAKGRNLRGLVLRCDPDLEGGASMRVERVEARGQAVQRV